jgi:hypothetical protein
MFVPTRKKTNEDASERSEFSDNATTVMSPTKILKLEDDGSVNPVKVQVSNSSYDSDSTGPLPLMLHRCDSWSSSASSASSDDEVELEIERKEDVRELLLIYNVRGNELPVACRACILCGELNHTYQNCPVEQELSFDICLAVSALSANDIDVSPPTKG